jgi:hypothetical protein
VVVANRRDAPVGRGGWFRFHASATAGVGQGLFVDSRTEPANATAFELQKIKNLRRRLRS